jgi:hypothetical protein
VSISEDGSVREVLFSDGALKAAPELTAEELTKLKGPDVPPFKIYVNLLLSDL